MELSRCVLLLVLLATACGCAVMRVSTTPRTVVEQQLIVRSLDRAVAQLDLERFRDRRVTLTLYGLTHDQEFARQFIGARLAEKGAILVGPGIEADLNLTVLATAIGTSQTEHLAGVPALAVPLTGFTLPEIRFFKWARNRGVSELQVYAYDARSHRLSESTPVATGHSRYDLITVLLFLTFRYSDLHRYPQEQQ